LEELGMDIVKGHLGDLSLGMLRSGGEGRLHLKMTNKKLIYVIYLQKY
jgi:hypothetical protein